MTWVVPNGAGATVHRCFTVLNGGRSSKGRIAFELQLQDPLCRGDFPTSGVSREARNGVSAGVVQAAVSKRGQFPGLVLNLPKRVDQHTRIGRLLANCFRSFARGHSRVASNNLLKSSHS